MKNGSRRGCSPRRSRPLADAEAACSAALARGIVGEGLDGPPGYLVINPVGIARRVAVTLPDGAADLQASGPLRAAQLTEDGVQAVVDLAAFGYAWIPRTNPASAPQSAPEHLAIRDRTLGNGVMSVSLDPGSGGVRGVSGINEPTARLGQQLVIVGLTGSDGKPATSTMTGTGFEADYGGPALVQATTTGTLHHPADGRRLASFTQRHRIWTGRPTLEIDVTLADLDPSWLAVDRPGRPVVELPRLPLGLARPRVVAPPHEPARPRDDHRRPARDARRDRHPLPTAQDRPSSSAASRITSASGRGCSTRSWSPARKRPARSASASRSTSNTRGRPRSTCLAPAYVVPTDAGPPKTGPAGWLVTVDTKSVAVIRLAFLDRSGDGRGWGLDLTLLETAGRSTRCKVRTFRDPVWARQLDFNDETIVDLPTDGDSVLVDLTPHELARVDITLG